MYGNVGLILFVFFPFLPKKRTMKLAQSKLGLLETKGKTSAVLPQSAQTVFVVTP